MADPVDKHPGNRSLLLVLLAFMETPIGDALIAYALPAR